MPQYFVTLYRPDNYDGSTEGADMRREISDLNKEMIAAGVRKFAGGLDSETKARTVTVRAGGETQHGEGAFVKSGQHIGGFWILETATMEEAMEWGRKASIACRAPVEVRPFLGTTLSAKAVNPPHDIRARSKLCEDRNTDARHGSSFI